MITDDEQKTIRLRHFDLSLCDSDIADAYKEYGVLNYQAERPLILQLSRDIRGLISLLQRPNFEPQIGSTDNCEKNGANCNGTS